jgi:hypothetical protein
MVREPARFIACKTAIQRLIERIGTPFSNAQLLDVQDHRTVTIRTEVKNGAVEKQVIASICQLNGQQITIELRARGISVAE